MKNRRLIQGLLLLMLLLLMATPASAAVSRLRDYALVVDGKDCPLSSKTGYLFREGTRFLIPVPAAMDALGLSYKAGKLGKNMTITAADGTVVQLRVDSKKIMVGDEFVKLRMRTGRQDGSIITADVLLLKSLGGAYKHYKPSAATRAAGYESGVLVLSGTADGDLSLPNRADDKPDDLSALPPEAREAAKTATQIVTVDQDDREITDATLRLFEKEKNGVWTMTAETEANLGRNGIGKTKEGDGKTPTGTFNLTTPFGILPDPGATLGDYLKVTKYHYWSGASGDPEYNKLIDTRVDTDYKPTSADEHLIDYAGAYNYACFIDYNAAGEAGKGSCIFLHCTGSSGYTAGCIAVRQGVMRTLLQTLKPGAKIVIYP